MLIEIDLGYTFCVKFSHDMRQLGGESAAMQHLPVLQRPEDDQKAANRQTESLAGLALTIAILVVSLFVLRQLQYSTKLEDCIMAGRLSCGMPALVSMPAQKRI